MAGGDARVDRVRVRGRRHRRRRRRHPRLPRRRRRPARDLRARLPRLRALVPRSRCPRWSPPASASSSPYLRGYAPSTPARDGRYDAAALGSDLVAARTPLLARRAGAPRRPRLGRHRRLRRRRARSRRLLAPGHRRRAAPARRRRRASLAAAQLRRSWYMGFFQLRAPRRAPPRRATTSPSSSACGATGRPAFRRAARRARRRQGQHARARARGARLLPRDLLARHAVDRAPAAPPHARPLALRARHRRRLHRRRRSPTESSAPTPAPIAVHRLAGGHFVHQEAVEQFNGILVEFLKTPCFHFDERPRKKCGHGRFFDTAPWPGAPVWRRAYSGHRRGIRRNFKGSAIPNFS